MDYAKLREYREVGYNGLIQVHHITCSYPTTLVIEFSQSFPGGFSVEEILETIQKHERVYHSGEIEFDQLLLDLQKVMFSRKVALNTLCIALDQRFGRPATRIEISEFVKGDRDRRLHIWNFGLPNG